MYETDGADLGKRFLEMVENTPKTHDMATHQRDQALLTMLREQRENNLSSVAAKSKYSQGRLFSEPTCSVRSDYERDIGRIIFSQAFRRLRHKTQVFFNPQNDHICSRIEHVIYVDYVASTIARALNLNLELVKGIALGHDLGHAPFGHSGERTLRKCLKKVDAHLNFQHELQSLRVVDLLSLREGHSIPGLNLTFEVRDGIVSHCGETYSEYILTPCRSRKLADLKVSEIKGRPMPATLEGCIVRIADKIAYIGRDVEDAARAGILAFSDLPKDITDVLGTSNQQIIHKLVTDIIHHSLDQDGIKMSEECGQAMEALLKENVRQIYQSDKIKKYEQRVELTVEGLFQGLLEVMEDVEKNKTSSNLAVQGFMTFLASYPDSLAPTWRIITDYIAGMTDSYANKAYESLYWI